MIISHRNVEEKNLLYTLVDNNSVNVKILVSYPKRDSDDFADKIYESLIEDHKIFTDIKNMQIGDI
jgi:hypothetical protein